MLETYIKNEQAYDGANWIIENSKDETLIQLANEFLQEYAVNEELIGDDDNAFNPHVHGQCELEEKFLTKLKTLC